MLKELQLTAIGKWVAVIDGQSREDLHKFTERFGEVFEVLAPEHSDFNSRPQKRWLRPKENSAAF